MDSLDLQVLTQARDWFAEGHDVLRMFNDTSHLGTNLTSSVGL